MFWKPVKHDANVVNPPREVKQLANSLFSNIQSNYRKNLKAFKANPEPHLRNVLNDPWWSRESWRWDPYLSPKNALKRVFPGLGIALTAFTAYLVYDFVAGSREQENEAINHD